MKAPVRFINLFITMAVAMPTAHAVSPDDAYNELFCALRRHLGFPKDTGQSGDMWLSLTVVGALATADDPAAVNDLADFAPTASPYITSFSRSPKLSDIYESLIAYSVPPERKETDAYKAARELLYDANDDATPAYKKFREFEDKMLVAQNKLLLATDLAVRNSALSEIKHVRDDWNAMGKKGDIDDALGEIGDVNFIMGKGMKARRRDILQAYRDLAVKGNGGVFGDFSSPLSTLSVSPDKWSQLTNWSHFDYSSSHRIVQTSFEERTKKGFGGVSFGFVNFGAKGGDHTVSETHIEDSELFEYSFDVARTSVRRYWIDEKVFFEPARWTWKTTPNTTSYPFVSSGRDNDGIPVGSIQPKIDNRLITVPLLPKEFILARNLKLTATMSTDNFNRYVKEGSISGGGSLFGIFGGAGGSSWKVSNSTTQNDKVTFTIESPGISIIGIISQMIDKCPAPATDTWPANAWLPNKN